MRNPNNIRYKQTIPDKETIKLWTDYHKCLLARRFNISFELLEEYLDSDYEKLYIFIKDTRRLENKLRA